MNVLDEARHRLRSKQWDDERAQRRAREFEKAMDRLEREEFLASSPDNQNRVRDIERIRAEKQEVLTMMDEEFKLSEQYKQIADGQ
jgi:hypothetical protein